MHITTRQKMLMALFQDFINLLYPKYCAACENVLLQSENYICLSCKEKLPRTNFHIQENNAVEQTFWGRVKIDEAAAYLYF